MILLILHNSITSWAGAAKITEHQATAVTPKVFSKKKLENSGETKTPKGDKYEVSWPYPCYHFYPGLFHWSCRALSPDRALMLWWVSMGTAVPWPRWHWHIWASALVPRALRGLGTLAGPDPLSVGFDHLFFLIKVALGHSPVIARVFQTPGWKQTPIKLSGSAKFKRWNKWIFTHYKNKINILLWHKVPEKLASKSRCDVLPVS